MSAEPDFITHVKAVYQTQRALAEGALQQVDDEQFFERADAESNSLAIIVKHVGGNLRSRWKDFLHSDGEKPDRNRDGEFVVESDSRDDIMRTWREGWSALETALNALDPNQLTATTTIKGAPYQVIHAILLNLAHTAHHVGQIVQVAKTLKAEGWQTLSIPRPGASKATQNFWK